MTVHFPQGCGAPGCACQPRTGILHTRHQILRSQGRGVLGTRASAEGVASPQRKPPRLSMLSPLAWNLEQREETGLTFPPGVLPSA